MEDIVPFALTLERLSRCESFSTDPDHILQIKKIVSFGTGSGFFDGSAVPHLILLSLDSAMDHIEHSLLSCCFFLPENFLQELQHLFLLLDPWLDFDMDTLRESESASFGWLRPLICKKIKDKLFNLGGAGSRFLLILESFLLQSIQLRDNDADLPSTLAVISLLHQLDLAESIEEIARKICILSIDDQVVKMLKPSFSLGSAGDMEEDEENSEEEDEEIQFRKSRLPSIEGWLESSIYPWFDVILKPQRYPLFESEKDCLKSLRDLCEKRALQKFCELRIADFFYIIIDFPESLPTLKDLRYGIEKTKKWNDLIGSLTISFQNKLLNPGANTKMIISQYINAIKSLEIVDPYDAVIEEITRIVSVYLAKREDSVRCIIQMFTEEDSDYFNEFCDIDSLHSAAEDDLENSNEYKVDHHQKATKLLQMILMSGNLGAVTSESNDEWLPASLDRYSPTNTKKNKKDIFSALAILHGSRENFVSEYRNLLTEKLLALTDYDVDKETKVVELLKLRFGESALQNCEIMLKDIADSKRINTVLHQRREENGENPINPIIYSHLFWPSLKDEEFQLAPAFKDALQDYETNFKLQKGSRKLLWKPSLGSIKISVDIEGDDATVTSQEFITSPLHVMILKLFEEYTDALSVQDVSNLLGTTVEVVSKKIGFWVSSKVLVCENERYSIATSQSKTSEDQGDQMEDASSSSSSSSSSSAVSSLADVKAAMWNLCKEFINSMITNQGKMAAEKIHMNLVTFMGMMGYNANYQELLSYLDRLVIDDVLERSGDEFSIKKS